MHPRWTLVIHVHTSKLTAVHGPGVRKVGGAHLQCSLQVVWSQEASYEAPRLCTAHRENLCLFGVRL